MAPTAKRPAAAAEPADKRTRLDGGPTPNTSAMPVRFPRVPRGDTRQPRLVETRGSSRDLVRRRGVPPMLTSPPPAHPQTVAAIVLDLGERARANGVHPTTVQSLAAPFADAGFAAMTEHELHEGLASTLRVLRQIAGPEAGSEASPHDQGPTTRDGNINDPNVARAPPAAPAPALALGRALASRPASACSCRWLTRAAAGACDKSDVGGGRCEPRRGKRCVEPGATPARGAGAVHRARGACGAWSPPAASRRRMRDPASA